MEMSLCAPVYLPGSITAACSNHRPLFNEWRGKLRKNGATWSSPWLSIAAACRNHRPLFNEWRGKAEKNDATCVIPLALSQLCAGITDLYSMNKEVTIRKNGAKRQKNVHSVQCNPRNFRWLMQLRFRFEGSPDQSHTDRRLRQPPRHYKTMHFHD